MPHVAALASDPLQRLVAFDLTWLIPATLGAASVGIALLAVLTVLYCYDRSREARRELEARRLEARRTAAHTGTDRKAADGRAVPPRETPPAPPARSAPSEPEGEIFSLHADDPIEWALSRAREGAVGAEGQAPASPSPPKPPAPRAPRGRRAPPPPPRHPQPAGDPIDLDEHARLSAALASKGRFEEAARLAREGLASHPGVGRLLLRLSEAEAGLGRLGAATDAALGAHRAQDSPAGLGHLVRLLTQTRRFQPGDGEWLRRALERNPGEPAFLHAAGVFEAMHGDPWAAQGLLRAALHHETRQETLDEIADEIARLEETVAVRASR